MDCFRSVLYTLAIAIWMQVRITNGAFSSNVALTSSNMAGSDSTGGGATTNAAISTSVVSVQKSSADVSISIVKTSVTAQASHNVTSGIRSVATTSVAVQPSHTVTLHSVATTTVAVHASRNFTSGIGSVATITSVAMKASYNVTQGSVATTSVAVQSSAVATNIASIGSNSASVAVQASDITSSVMSSYMSSPVIGSSAYSNKTFQPSQQVSTIPSSFTSMESSYSSAKTSFVLQSTFTLSAPGQTSKTTRLPSSDVIMQSPKASQSTRVLVHSSSRGKSSATVMTQNFVGSLTVAGSYSSSTSSPPINATSATPDTTPSSSIAGPRPTLPPEGTKFVNMEVSFEMEFKKEYSNPSSPEYKELEKNLTTTLEEVYKNVKGFVGIRIILIKEGSVVCSFVVILAKDADVEKSKLKEILDKAKLPFKVKSIKVTEDESKETEENLPGWAKATMIVLGCLCAVFMIIVIYVCVQYRRSLFGDSDAYFVSSGELGLGHTYDTVGDNKMRANQGYGKTSAPERRVIGSHSNPAYGANGAFAD